jgi:hypothetical protein
MSLAAPEFRAAEPMDVLLARVVLPRYGHVIRKLSLRGTDVSDAAPVARDAALRAVVRGCPALRSLDVRDCDVALLYEHDEQYAFMDLMLDLYARAPPAWRAFRAAAEWLGWSAVVLAMRAPLRRDERGCHHRAGGDAGVASQDSGGRG